jgi:hypothetical protein
MPQHSDQLTERVYQAADGLRRLLGEAAAARAARNETSGADDGGNGSSGTGSTGSAVCAWNHFENIPTFYNWNNRPR